MPKVRIASRTTLSSSSVSHHILSTNGYLPSMTISMTVMPKVCPASAGTDATSLDTSAGFISEMSWPPT